MLYVFFSLLSQLKKQSFIKSRSLPYVSVTAEVFHLVFNLPALWCLSWVTQFTFYSYSLSLNSFLLFCFVFLFRLAYVLGPDIYEQSTQSSECECKTKYISICMWKRECNQSLNQRSLGEGMSSTRLTTKFLWFLFVCLFYFSIVLSEIILNRRFFYMHKDGLSSGRIHANVALNVAQIVYILCI